LSECDKVNLKRSQPTILVSIGGGRIGYELLETVITASTNLADLIPHHIQIFAGPFMSEAQYLQLEQATVGKSNVTLQRFTSNLMTYMSASDLSISLTGYNTTMNIMRTGVRSLVVPIGHYENDQEQLLRTRKLEKLGVVEVIEPEKLEPVFLAQKIINCLHKKSTRTANSLFDLQGAEHTTALLSKLLKEPALALS
jgi:predicted glycosyltransferase